jgi:Lhr-like helicase
MPLNIGRPPEFATNSQGERVRNERDTHSKDIIQPFIGTKVNEEFARAYPGKINDNFDRNTLQSL